MKKTLLTLIAAITLCGTAIAQTAAEKAAGEYSGVLYVNLAMPVTDESEPLYLYDEDGNPVIDVKGNPVMAIYEVKIQAQSDNTVKFGLYNFGFMGIELGDIVLDNVPVEDTPSGRVVFGENTPVFFNFVDGEILATAKINENNSYIEGQEAFIDVDVVWTNANPELDADDTSDDVPIYVRFKGKKPADGPDPKPADPYDLNGDGEVNVGDVTTLVNMILGKAEINPAADLNKDGDVNVGDVTTLVNVILGK